MPLFMDIHRLDNSVTPEMVAQAHAADVEVQEAHGVCYHGYWYNSDAATVVCFVEGPDRQACEAVHRAAHGLVPDEIIEVPPGSVEAFMGGGTLSPEGVALLPDGSRDPGIRVLLVTELENLAAIGGLHGDAAALTILERHDRLVREMAARHGGHEVRHLGDGMMLSFASASGAERCALELQRQSATHDRDGDRPTLRIGIAAGEPVAQHQRLFGVAVDQARAVCRAAQPGEILVSATVRDLCVGKGLSFAAAAAVRLPGSAKPTELVSVLPEGPRDARRPITAEPPRYVDSGHGTRYALERELGRGGMATVYLARDLRHDRPVAVKVLRPELAAALGTERFLQEIRVASRLTHPNIVSLYDSGEADGMLFYVMPHLEGETLRQMITRERQLPVDRAVAIAVRLAAAVEHAHRQGVIHRDIKPENILLHEDQPMVLDFGIALAVTQASDVRLTEPGLLLGTPAYMSPEQAVGDRAADARTDVYALACVLYELLAGDPPFVAGTVRELITSILTEAPPSVAAVRPDVPAHVDRAVRRALSKAPADRFSSAHAFAAALSDPL
jgi:class 3 adenylate cyclase